MMTAAAIDNSNSTADVVATVDHDGTITPQPGARVTTEEIARLIQAGNREAFTREKTQLRRRLVLEYVQQHPDAGMPDVAQVLHASGWPVSSRTVGNDLRRAREALGLPLPPGKPPRARP